MRDAVSHFATASLSERVREIEGARQVPEDIRQSAHEMGLAGVAVPESVGGQGLGMVTAVLLEESSGGMTLPRLPPFLDPGRLAGRLSSSRMSKRRAGSHLTSPPTERPALAPSRGVRLGPIPTGRDS